MSAGEVLACRNPLWHAFTGRAVVPWVLGGRPLTGDVLELRDPQSMKPGAPDPDAERALASETFIESDAPEVIAEATKAVNGVSGARARAERLTRYVNALLDKKPTVSLPSAREVLRTKVGDCNEHTVLYVAMARALGIPARCASHTFAKTDCRTDGHRVARAPSPAVSDASPDTFAHARGEAHVSV